MMGVDEFTDLSDEQWKAIQEAMKKRARWYANYEFLPIEPRNGQVVERTPYTLVDEGAYMEAEDGWRRIDD